MGPSADLQAGFPRPRLVLSRCLELDACRYNAAIIRAPLVRRLEPWVDLLPICPEVEIGLGVPRAPIRLVRSGGATALVQPVTGRDLTAAMADFSARFLAGLPEVDGFLLKARSPSCGIHGVKVFGDTLSEDPRARGVGMFAAAVAAAHPEHPIEHEARLGNPRLLDDFLTRIFALAALRDARALGGPEGLRALHRRYETTLRVHGGDAEARALGRIADGAADAPAEAWRGYAAGFRRSLAAAPRPRAHAEVVTAIVAELAEHAPGDEERPVRALLEEYRVGVASRRRLLAALRAWASRMRTTRFEGYLSPYPAELEEES